MKNIRNLFSYLPKSASGFVGLLLAVLLPLQVLAAPAVQIEADLQVENNTTNTGYQDSVNAKVDEVITVQLWYHNMEDEESGLVAENLRANFDVPTEKGRNQVIKATVGGDNTNIIEQQVSVNLSLDNAYLEYIPGSAQWRHNAGTNDNVNYVTESISDGVVTNVNGVVVEDAQPCFNYEATITIQLRVKADVVSVVKEVSQAGQDDGWSTENTAEVGDVLEYLITVKNEGNSTLHNVIVGDALPNYIEYVPNTAMLYNSNSPNGRDIVNQDKLFDGGIDIGDYAPGAVAYVMFEARVMDELANECGMFTLRNKAQVNSDETEEFFNLAITKVDQGVCEQEVEFDYACDALNVQVLNRDNRQVRATVNASASGEANITGYTIDFGDGTVVNQQTAEHTYQENETYTIRATVNFSTPDGEQSDSGETCVTQVQFEDDEKPPIEPPVTELPNTGPASFVATMLTVGTAAAGAHSWILRKRA